MSFVHGKNTVITVATKDISAFCNKSQLTRGANVHNLTTYGKNSEVNAGGLKKNEFTCEGIYDNTAVTGPAAVLRGQEGNTLAVVRKPEGTGTGKPQEAFSAVLEQYVETSPTNDFVAWSAKFTVSDDITTTAQP